LEFSQENINDPLATKKKVEDQEIKWMRTVLQSGTLLDKLSALSMLINKSPLYCLKYLEMLNKMAMKKGKRESELAINSLKQVYLQTLLPKNQKLKTFTQYLKAAGEKKNNEEILIKAYFEHNLKRLYRQFIDKIESLTKDTVPHVKKNMIGILVELLMQKPEEEKTLLSMIINKYGDKERKVAKHVSSCLKKLLRVHPNMTMVVLAQLSQFVSKNIPQASITLIVRFINKLQQIPPTILREVLDEKIKIYLGLLNLYLKPNKPHTQEAESEARTVEKIIKGLVLIGQHHKSKIDALIKYVGERDKDLYKLSYVGEIKARVYALKLLFLVEGNRNATPSNRFYRSLYELMFSIELMESSMLEQFFTIILQSIKQDNDSKRVNAILKRLLQQCSMAQINYTITALLVFAKALQLHPALSSCITQPDASAFDPHEDDENFQDKPDDSDSEEKPVKKPKKQDSEIGNLAYDWHKRDPLFANADKTCFWELTGLSMHFHPLISKWAYELLQKGKEAKLEYEGKNPILDFKVINLLDRMTYKEPKKRIGKSTARSANIEIPITSYYKELKGNSDEKMQKPKNTGNIKPHEEFFARYFENREKSLVNKKKAEKKALNDKENIDEIADEIMEKEMKKIAGDPDIDDAEGILDEENLDEPFSDLEENELEPEDEKNEKIEDEPFSDLENEGENLENEDFEDNGEQKKAKMKKGKKREKPEPKKNKKMKKKLKKKKFE